MNEVVLPLSVITADAQSLEDIQMLLLQMEGMRKQLDNFIHYVTLEFETVQVKLSRILKEVVFVPAYTPEKTPPNPQNC